MIDDNRAILFTYYHSILLDENYQQIMEVSRDALDMSVFRIYSCEPIQCIADKTKYVLACWSKNWLHDQFKT